MRRPALVAGVILAQLFEALALLALSLLLLFETRSSEMAREPDVADAIQGLMLAAGILAGPAVVLLAALPGLWRRRRWGWWLAVFVNAGLTGVLVYAMADDGWRNLDLELLGITLSLAVMLGLLFLPGVVRFFWRGGTSPSSETPPGTPFPAA